MDHLFDMRPERPGYRLHRLELFNWGTFDSTAGNVFRFEPQGRTSLLVGHNGSGKSTLVDAILTLLVDGRTRNYNVAAGAKKTERTPKSYIKGAYDRTSDESHASIVKYLRPKGNHLTAISAVFRDEQLDRSFTLTQILYLKADGSDDKVFAIADEPHELQHDLAGLQKSNEVREHLNARGYQTSKTYIEYQGWLTKRTQMRGKAIDMFNQTVAVKDIQSLNTFIRGHMLEAHDWQDKVQKLLTHFDDLSTAHEELVRARRAEELLTPIEKIGGKYRQQAEKSQELEQHLEAAKTFFPVQLLRLFTPEVERQQEDVASRVTVIARLASELKETQETIRSLRNEIDQAGGERLKQIPGLIKIEQTHLEHKQAVFENYHANLKICRINGVVKNAKLFQQAREHLQKTQETTAGKIAVLKEKHENAIGRKASLEADLRSERDELAVLQQRRTNLPSRFTTMRSNICSDLQLDESVLPFAAELIAVLPDERRWEASVEMVLKSFALSLLVPERYYARVRAYVESNRVTDARGEGQRLDYLRIGKLAESTGDRIDPQSLSQKLHFKPRHDLSPWVRGEILRRFEFRCCNSVAEFNDATSFAMTENRHVKYNKQRHQKDDRDRTANPRYFVLGWDNTEKKRRIASHIQELESQQKELEELVAACSHQLEQLFDVERAASAALGVTDFDAIDVGRHQAEIEALEKEKRELTESNDVVQALQKRLQEAESQVEQLDSERDSQVASKANLETEILRVNQMLAKAAAEVQASKAAGQYALHEKLYDGVVASLGKTVLTLENFSVRQNEWETDTREQLSAIRKPLQNLGQRLVSAMSDYLRNFKEESADLDNQVESLDSFLGRLQQLREEDLPRHEKKFKDRLNDQVSQEVGLFNTALNQESKQIKDKIGLLNKALADVEYRRGTFMRLEPQIVKDGEIDDFRRSLRACLDESLEHTDEANEARFDRIQKLVARLSDKEKRTWRNKVIDVRNWYDFAAQEISRETGKIQSCYDGSSGQSGGEKAKLAFTILVAALAYQFDIDPTGDTPGRFQFVVVDEMFSKVDDENAQFALKLFKQFGLQLLIVAPLDAKARITESFVDRYLHVVKDAKTNRSQIYSMTAREYDEVVKQFAGNGKPTKTRRVAAK